MAVKEFIKGELYVLEDYSEASRQRTTSPYWVHGSGMLEQTLKPVECVGTNPYFKGGAFVCNGTALYWPPEHAHKVVTKFEVGKRYLIRRPTGKDGDPHFPWVSAMDGLAGKVGTCVEAYADVQDYKSASLKVDGAGTFTYRNTHCLEIYEPDEVAKEPKVAEVKAEESTVEAPKFEYGKRYRIVKTQPGLEYSMEYLVGHTFVAQPSEYVSYVMFEGWSWHRDWVEPVPDYTPLGPKLEPGKSYRGTFKGGSEVPFTVVSFKIRLLGETIPRHMDCFSLAAPVVGDGRQSMCYPDSVVQIPTVLDEPPSASPLTYTGDEKPKTMHNKLFEAGVYATITPEQPVEIPTANEVLEAVPVVGVTEGTYASSSPADLSMLASWKAEPKVKYNPKFRRICRHDWVVGEEHIHEWGPAAGHALIGGTGLAVLTALGGAVANNKGLLGTTNDPFAGLLLALGTLTALAWMLVPTTYRSPSTPIFTRRRQDKICMKCGRTSLKLTAHKQKELAKRAAATAKACAEQQKIDDRVELERQALEKLKSYTTLARKAQA